MQHIITHVITSYSIHYTKLYELEPEPIALDIKVVLTGDRQLYYLLAAYDPDFRELFKVAADFDDEFMRAKQTQDETVAYIV